VIEYARYGRLGVRRWSIIQDVVANLHLRSTWGVIVTDVDETGAAKPAGIQVGDVTMRMGGEEESPPTSDSGLGFLNLGSPYSA
jgi:hypothetical protein